MTTVIVNARPLDLLPLQSAVQPSGGGRAIREQTTMAGALLRSVGPKQALTIAFKSPAGAVISDADAEFLLALYATGGPFSLSLAGQYVVEGTWTSALFVGKPLFPKLIRPGYRGYDFTVNVGQE